MQFNISVIKIEKSTQPTKSGKSYQQVEVMFKDHTAGGQIKSKKVISFKYPEVFKAISDCKEGDNFSITAEKEGDYWQWVAILQNAHMQKEGLSSIPNKSSTTPIRSTYETPEERAARQVLIVKQSSLSAAIAALTPGSKAPLDPANIIDYAQQFTDWVFAKPEVPQPTFANMEDDIPY